MPAWAKRITLLGINPAFSMIAAMKIDVAGSVARPGARARRGPGDLGEAQAFAAPPSAAEARFVAKAA